VRIVAASSGLLGLHRAISRSRLSGQGDRTASTRARRREVGGDHRYTSWAPNRHIPADQILKSSVLVDRDYAVSGATFTAFGAQSQHAVTILLTGGEIRSEHIQQGAFACRACCHEVLPRAFERRHFWAGPAGDAATSLDLDVLIDVTLIENHECRGVDRITGPTTSGRRQDAVGWSCAGIHVDGATMASGLALSERGETVRVALATSVDERLANACCRVVPIGGNGSVARPDLLRQKANRGQRATLLICSIGGSGVSGRASCVPNW